MHMQMQAAAEYHFTTESVMLSRDETPAISGIRCGGRKNAKWIKQLNNDGGFFQE